MGSAKKKKRGEKAILVSAKRAGQLRNGVIAGVVAFGAAAVTFSGPRVPVVWADDDVSFFSTPGEQLMQERLRAEGHVAGSGLNARQLKALSEARLQALFEDKDAGLWHRTCGADGKGEDYEDCLPGEQTGADAPVPAVPDDTVPPVHEAIKTAARAVPVALGAGAVIDGLRAVTSGASRNRSATRTEGAGGGGADLGVPIGAIGGSLAGGVMSIDDDGRGRGSIPQNPGDDTPGNPAEPALVPSPDDPGGEVPIPAPLILFPAGLALLRLARRPHQDT